MNHQRHLPHLVSDCLEIGHLAVPAGTSLSLGGQEASELTGLTKPGPGTCSSCLPHAAARTGVRAWELTGVDRPADARLTPITQEPAPL